VAGRWTVDCYIQKWVCFGNSGGCVGKKDGDDPRNSSVGKVSCKDLGMGRSWLWLLHSTTQEQWGSDGLWGAPFLQQPPFFLSSAGLSARARGPSPGGDESGKTNQKKKNASVRFVKFAKQQTIKITHSLDTDTDDFRWPWECSRKRRRVNHPQRRLARAPSPGRRLLQLDGLAGGGLGLAPGAGDHRRARAAVAPGAPLTSC